MDLSVVVAAYNEEAVISNNLSLMIKELSSRPEITWELICVNDGSTDRTGEIIDAIAQDDDRVSVIHHRRNFGQGRALRNAFDQAKGGVISTVDADLSYGVEYIYKLADVIWNDDVEIALASAYMDGGEVKNIPLARRILSRFGNYYLSAQSAYPIKTSTCVVRAYHRDVIDSIVFLSDGMELQIEILTKSHMMGFRVKEIPAKLEWVERKETGLAPQRQSKMNKSRAIRLYLTMGWLFKPALSIFIIAAILLSMGTYLLFNNIIRYVFFVNENIDAGFVQALSISLKELVLQYPHTVIFCMSFFLFGGLMVGFALVLIQNKAYYEDLLKLAQMKVLDVKKNTSASRERG